MEASAGQLERVVAYPISVEVRPAVTTRNRLTAAFRFFLALPHLILVGGPAAVMAGIGWRMDHVFIGYGFGGILAVVAAVAGCVSWVAILITGRYPERLRRFAVYYLRWRIRAIAYMTLLRDEYPPFGTDPYPAKLDTAEKVPSRNRLTVFFRFFLALPHMIALVPLGIAWGLATAIAWAAILVTGRHPEILYGLGIGVLAWSMRVEAYMLLLTDEYPPFTLRA
jgi:hypothetical protein